MKKVITTCLMLAMVTLLTACAGATHAERQSKNGALIGAGAGALLGQAIGRNTGATLIGAGIGAVAGSIAGQQIGSYMDRQEQERRRALADAESASVRRSYDTLTATFQSDILFDYDSSELKPGAYQEIGRVAGVLRAYPETTITVEGHTDARGPSEYNYKLSKRRSSAVKAALVHDGIDPRRIRTVGLGETQPVSSDYALNRRVNIVIDPVRQRL